ncbi:methyl-accepting chemotaxis protein [Sulfitobacter geojensis]|uniref:methyl-accepting chemotaxis protein n=1 Tax=Sulfitobacter geojensis TaxID=1342299 RepID=UPI003B8D707E
MHAVVTQTPERMIFALATLFVPIVAVVAAFVGANFIVTTGISVSFLALGALMARNQPTLASVGPAVALIGQAIALTAAFEGHPWQIDSHMLFFALLACLVSMRSLSALLVGAILIALHHLSLAAFMPALIYPSGGLVENFGRTALHAVIVVLETSALLATVHNLNQMHSKMRAQTGTLRSSLDDADKAKQSAIASKSEAEASRAQAESAQREAEAALSKVKEATALREEAEARQSKLDQEKRDVENKQQKAQMLVVDTLRVALIELEGGDLSTRITQAFPEEYQALADGFNSAVQSLDDLVAEVLYHSEQMGGEIRDISSATNDLAHRTESQAANLQITSEELDELTQSVLLNAKNVDQANGNSSQAKSSAQTSGVVVSEASTAMRAIKTEAEEIAKIVTLIEGISFQTNLLALNAGVEAARAGDAGRGFAVVASEVRALAQRSSESVVSIRALIERSTGQVNDGSKKISDTVSSLEAVEVAIVDITSKMGEISSSTQEQSKRITTINKSISEMGGVTQRNAAMFEETNAACTNLANGADELQQLTRRFKISENGRVGLAAA